MTTTDTGPQTARHELEFYLRGALIGYDAEAVRRILNGTTEYLDRIEAEAQRLTVERLDFWFAQGTLIHGRDRGGIDIGPLIGEARTDESARSIVESHNNMIRAALAHPEEERSGE